MNKWMLLVVLSALFAGCATHRSLVLNIDWDFQYVAEGWPLGLSVGQTDAPPLAAKPSEVLSKEPPYHGTKVLYGSLLLGNSEDNRYTFVLDDLDEKTWIAYFDRNNNEDLTDDGGPLRNQGTGKFATTIELDVPIVAASGETLHRPYKLWLWVGEDNGVLVPRFYAVCHYRAEVHIRQTKVTAIVFEERNHDALYKDAGIWLDLNADNVLDTEREHFATGNVVELGGRSYLLNLDYP